MPVCSYLVHIKEGRSASVTEELNRFPECEATPAQNRDLLILVTETDSKHADDELRKRIESISDIECLALTFGADNKQEAPS